MSEQDSSVSAPLSISSSLAELVVAEAITYALGDIAYIHDDIESHKLLDKYTCVLIKVLCKKMVWDEEVMLKRVGLND